MVRHLGFAAIPSINAERAARQMIAACRYGDAELVITIQARIAMLARTSRQSCSPTRWC